LQNIVLEISIIPILLNFRHFSIVGIKKPKTFLPCATSNVAQKNPQILCEI